MSPHDLIALCMSALIPLLAYIHLMKIVSRQSFRIFHRNKTPIQVDVGRGHNLAIDKFYRMENALLTGIKVGLEHADEVYGIRIAHPTVTLHFKQVEETITVLSHPSFTK